MEFLKELARRADLDWQTWALQYRVLAVVLGLLAAWLALRALLPAVLRLLRPVLFAVLVLLAIWALYPAETCSIEFLARLPVICAG